MPADWWAAVQADIAQAEYAVTWQEQTYLADLPAAYQAPNRAQGLRMYFSTTGATVIPREWPEGATEPPWRLDLRLDAWGRAGDMQQVEASSELGGAPRTTRPADWAEAAPQTTRPADWAEAAPQTTRPADWAGAVPEVVDNRVEYGYGPLAAWYRNDPEGLAVGVRLDAAPTSQVPGARVEGRPESAGHRLRVTLGWGGGLTAASDDAATAVSVAFSDAEGDVLLLGAPTAHDATGRPLDVWLSVEDGALVYEVDDADAVYPIEMDARLVQSSEIGPEQPRDPISDVISPAGLPAGHNWTVTWAVANTDYGFAVSTAGDVNNDGYSDVIIGADRFDGGQIDEGRAFLFLGGRPGCRRPTPGARRATRPARGSATRCRRRAT